MAATDRGWQCPRGAMGRGQWPLLQNTRHRSRLALFPSGQAVAAIGRTYRIPGVNRGWLLELFDLLHSLGRAQTLSQNAPVRGSLR